MSSFTVHLNIFSEVVQLLQTSEAQGTILHLASTCADIACPPPVIMGFPPGSPVPPLPPTIKNHAKVNWSCAMIYKRMQRFPAICSGATQPDGSQPRRRQNSPPVLSGIDLYLYNHRVSKVLHRHFKRGKRKKSDEKYQ